VVGVGGWEGKRGRGSVFWIITEKEQSSEKT
jgi:hypothetical protein